MATIADLSDRNAVLAAIAQFDAAGRDAFLERHGFGHAKWWYLLHDGRQYDSKAIAGVALGIQFALDGRPVAHYGGTLRSIEEVKAHLAAARAPSD